MVNKVSNYDPNQKNNLSLDEIEELEQEEKKKAKKEKFNIFNRFNKESEGVDKDEIQIADNPTLPNFFKLLGRKLSQFFSVNIIMILGNFPIFFFLLALAGFFSIHTTSPYYMVFAPLRGAMLFDNSPAVSALWTVFSRQADVTVLTTVDYVLIALGALIIFTFGPVRVGVTYIVRNLFRGEPVFMMHDFFYAIKRNLRQSIIVGILDVGIVGLIAYDIMFFSLNQAASSMMQIMFYMSICLAFLYYVMRNYIYLMLITFDISILKMYKNALLFIVLGLKRNIMAVLGVVAVLMLEYFLMYVFFPLAAIMPFVIIPSLIVLISVYSAYPKIKEIMIDPFYQKVKTKASDDSDEDEEEEDEETAEN
ncbi:MAG: DUF624 domain-containing protein [Ruminococcaceae bacterium]|nr:DUF624 domain-containing protein [Oscillospiraceae bacterium]